MNFRKKTHVIKILNKMLTLKIMEVGGETSSPSFPS